MTTSRLSTAAKALVLVLLAALSITWTATLVTVGSESPAAGSTDPATLPDGTRLPTEASYVQATGSE